MKVYLAGKIQHQTKIATDWRELVLPFKEMDTSGIIDYGVNENNFSLMSSEVIREGLKPYRITKDIEYTGPFFVNCPYEAKYFSHTSLLAHSAELPHWAPWDNGKMVVFERSMAGIKKCDLFFAWITSEDSFGTICEIVTAKNLNKFIFIGYDADKVSTDFYRDMWFVNEYANYSTMGVHVTQIWRFAVDCFNRRLKSWTRL